MKGKKYQRMHHAILFIFMICIALVPLMSFGDENQMTTAPTAVPGSEKINFDQIEKEVLELMEDGDIPGLTLVILKGDQKPYIKGFGFADKNKGIKVTPKTLFELGSCSKAFSALAVLKMEEEGKINLDDTVSKYFKGFAPRFDNKTYQVTIRQLLHHTSGMPTGAVSVLKPGADDNALANLVEDLSDMELAFQPGTEYQYSTVNYDIAAAIIEKISGVSFESYMTNNILKPLGLHNSFMGVNQENPPADFSVGHKIAFFKPRPFVAPVYRSNNAAGYMVSNGIDMARWLKLQLGDEATHLSTLINKSHQPDISVKPDPVSMTSYAMGWQVNPYGSQSITHGGMNPNFTSYMMLNPKERIGVALLVNSNSAYTGFIAGTVYNRLLYKQGLSRDFIPGGGLDKACSVLALLVGLALIAILVFYVSVVQDLRKGRRKFVGISMQKLTRIFGVALLYTPFLFGIYLLPKALSDATWDMVLTWAPISFQIAITLILLAMALSFLGFIISLFFPNQNKYTSAVPSLLSLSLLTGGANAVVIFLITGSLYVNKNLEYILYYFTLVLFLYIGGRKIVQTKLIKITMEIVFDMRMKLLGKIFFTSYQRFERLDQGRILATLNNDTGQIGASAGVFVGLVSSIITTVGVFFYLATIAFWATVVTILVIVIIAAVYYIVGQQAQLYLEEARDQQNVYLGLLDGMVAGFKELSLHIKKKLHYKDDLEESCDTFRNKSVTASVKLINAFLVGESLLIVVLGAVGFGVPRIFPAIKDATLMSFIIALLYLIGPINGILASIPALLQINVAWGRVQSFINDVPANMKLEDVDKPLPVLKEEIASLDSAKLNFQYKPVPTEEERRKKIMKARKGRKAVTEAKPEIKETESALAESTEESNLFSVGPIDFQAKRGEVIFIVGGNGSGKTTLAKMLTGLYESDEGLVTINGEQIPNHQIGEYFSVVFNDFHLFQKLYEVDLTGKEDKVKEYLELLELDKKVEIEDHKFSTINLSGGQRKRLALLQCYLEDSPIYLFDEVAADQDPQFRKFFYRTLLSEMKEQGKIVLAVTHDDHYFDVADKVIKLDMGQVEHISDGASLNVTK